ncbi:DUF2141 domain-containing protein [Methylobacterium sp. Leaf118]|uniref:DUF2141 domain-containing protein n=1 Tax=Methylobacterium sp. Leaf118 TaxID=2876562 RepID=UPI001E5F62E8|nr:DUF2141 domain-containing protein [Methylobacterium sp. Leaf118]
MRALATVLALAVLASGAARAASLEVTVEGAEPGAGAIYVTLCRGGLSESACQMGQDAPAQGGAQRFVISGVSAGTWAVAAFQDLDGDRRLGRTELGLPLEPYGFSGAVGRRARPDFAAASFTLSEPGASLRIRLARALPRR